MKDNDSTRSEQTETVESLTGLLQTMNLNPDQKSENMQQWTLSDMLHIMRKVADYIEADPELKPMLDGAGSRVTSHLLASELQDYLDAAGRKIQRGDLRLALVDFYWALLRIAAMRGVAFPEEAVEMVGAHEGGETQRRNDG